MGKVLPSQRLLKQFEERLVFGDMNLSEIVRSGAQMMLQYALEREVTEALGRGYYENAPETTKEKGRRNGYESHRVLTGEGSGDGPSAADSRDIDRFSFEDSRCVCESDGKTG